MDQDQESAIAVFTAIAIIAVYLLPFFIASCRAHKQAPLISIVNLFLGWTLLGWVTALIWAFTNNVYEKEDDTKVIQAKNDGLIQHRHASS